MLRDPLRDPHALSILSFEKIRRIQNFSGLRAPKKAPESKSLWSTSMNKRIRELIKQASYRIIETDGAPVISTEFDKEKFAELIIRECIDIVPWQYEENIKQHFGVEK